MRFATWYAKTRNSPWPTIASGARWPASACCPRRSARWIRRRVGRSGLSDHDRRLVAAHRAWLAGELAEADLGADTLVLGYPESLQGWFLLGDIRFHGNPDRGRSVVESRHAFERVLELDPEHTGALLHLARLDAIERHPEQASTRIERLLKLRPDADNALALRALRAFLLDDADGQTAVLNALPRASGFAMVDAFVEVAVTARNLPGAERLGRAMLRNARSDQFRALCHVAVAHVLHASGRIDDAFAELEALPALRAGWAVGARALLRTLPFRDHAARGAGTRSGNPVARGAA